MTESPTKILTEYRAADFTRRLHLYLQFPGLRSKFMLIDQQGLNHLKAGFKFRKNARPAQMSVVLGLMAGYVRRLFGFLAT